MHAGALRALEFDRIVEAVRRFALTPPGLRGWRGWSRRPIRARSRPRLPRRRRRSDSWPTTTSRCRRRPISKRCSIALGGRRTRAGSRCTCSPWRRFSPRSTTTCAPIRRARGGLPDPSRALPTRAASFEREIADIRRKIDPGGEVVDDASPELKNMRDRLRKQRARLRGTLESYLRGKDTSKYLQQQIVTDRNGRYVLVVRSEHRPAIPGIVHGSSGSGASLFLEPLSTVEINNDIVALEQQEAEEVRRILLALTDAFRRRADDLDRTVEAATELDVLQARAQFSIAGRRRRAGDCRGRTARAARRAASAADPGRAAAISDGQPTDRPGTRDRSIREARAGRHPADSAGERARHHRAEHRRQDRRAQDGGAAVADGAGGAADPCGRRIADPGVSARSLPTSATSSRSRRA